MHHSRYLQDFRFLHACFTLYAGHPSSFTMAFPTWHPHNVIPFDYTYSTWVLSCIWECGVISGKGAAFSTWTNLNKT